MNDYNIVIRPIITEQSTHFANTRGQYSFVVAKGANKTQIRNAVEHIYSVKVDKVRTANKMGKLRRRGRTVGRTASYKKAVIYLEPDYHIDLF